MEKLAVGHQEIDRIVDEVEQIYASQPMPWLVVEPIGMMLLNICDWYEDYDEFEDAVGGSFEGFLRALPQFELRQSPESGKTEFRVIAPDPDAPPIILTKASGAAATPPVQRVVGASSSPAASSWQSCASASAKRASWSRTR